MYASVAQLVERTAVKKCRLPLGRRFEPCLERFLYFPLNKYLFSENYIPVLKSVFF